MEREKNMPARVLIVEDDTDFATSLVMALDLVGIEATVAQSAEEAIAIMSRETGQIKLGFFDIKLPQEDGISCFGKVRSENPDFTGIIMTGFRDENLLAKARAAGVVEVLLKPFKMAEFMNLAQRYTGKTLN